jgi:pimeloyl-ACP methyl ester carboxylesterase
MIDIDGRSLRLVRAGPASSDRPSVLLEHGAFGCATDWAVVQERLAAQGLRSLAYDRAGLGYSDPGPSPRDGKAIVADLEKLLAKVGEHGPYVLVAHSMGGLFARLFAARHPDHVRGVVLVDAVTPEVIDGRLFAAGIHAFRGAMRLAGWTAWTGYMSPVSLVIGDRIGLSGAAAVEKRQIYALSTHTRWAAQEVHHWPAASRQSREAGDFRPDHPVAVVTAGHEGSVPRLKAIQTAPARASRRGYVEHVAGSTHANLLGGRFADRIVRGVEHVLEAAPS